MKIQEDIQALRPMWACIKCKSQRLTVQFNSSMVCKNCGNRYPIVNGIPIFLENFDIHQKFIDNMRKTKSEWYEVPQIPKFKDDIWTNARKRRYRLLSYLFEKYVPTDKMILDLGCGDGANLEFLKSFGAGVSGIDYNIERLARASSLKDGYNSVFLADILNLPLPKKSCDIIFFSQVLEHIPNPHDALLSVRRIMSNEGILILGVPNEGCWYYQIRFRIKPSLLKETDHVNFFTKRSLSKLLNDCGFFVKEAKGMGWGLPALGSRGVLGHISKVETNLRRYRWYNFLWEAFGHCFLPGQYFELYVICVKSA